MQTTSIADKKVILTSARKLVADGWTKYANARNEYGLECEFEDKYALSFCMNGALHRAIFDSKDTQPKLLEECTDIVLQAINELLQVNDVHAFCRDIVSYNDHVAETKDDILTVLDTAIEIASEE